MAIRSVHKTLDSLNSYSELYNLLNSLPSKSFSVFDIDCLYEDDYTYECSAYFTCTGVELDNGKIYAIGGLYDENGVELDGGHISYHEVTPTDLDICKQLINAYNEFNTFVQKGMDDMSHVLKKIVPKELELSWTNDTDSHYRYIIYNDKQYNRIRFKNHKNGSDFFVIRHSETGLSKIISDCDFRLNLMENIVPGGVDEIFKNMMINFKKLNQSHIDRFINKDLNLIGTSIILKKKGPFL